MWGGCWTEGCECGVGGLGLKDVNVGWVWTQFRSPHRVFLYWQCNKSTIFHCSIALLHTINSVIYLQIPPQTKYSSQQ